ncbi:E3 SUMO-protein ligase ZBED1-like [Saccostrea cucullata]|uniref:E3 SUMO-protein ligase ZBED1-like n=1 Tax=Saccostrea cuccullata TaxID=36930 RepID=UPI002ECFD47F
MFLEESSALDPRTKGKPCIQAETWERLEDKLSVMDLNVNAIKTEADARPVRPVNIPQVNHIPLPALPTIPDHLRSGSSTEDDSDNEISKPSEQKVPRTALESLFGDDEVLVTGEEFITPAELARKEVESYKGHKPASMKENPLAWWKENEVYFPKLARLARTYFCVQATSVASERVFSTTGDIVSATRIF